MKKRILFTLLRLNVGGIEKALLSLVNALDKDKYDIHLAVILPEGGFLSEVPPHVKLHTIGGFGEEPGMVFTPVKEISKKLLTFRWADGIPAAWHYAVSQLRGTLNPYCRWLLRGNRPGGRHADPGLDSPFDLAVDFTGPPGEYLEYFAGIHVKARRRCAWIHFDLDRVFVRPKSSIEVYNNMDKVFCVSEKALSQFRQRFPRFAHKGEVLHNIIDVAAIRRLGEAPSGYVPVEGAVNIVTVGRVARQKGQDIALRSLRILRSQGHDIFWHFVGDGPQMQEYRELAARLGVADTCRFHGATTNPYPFMRGCDLYVQPSRYEGYCITLGEAKLFGAPILATDFVGASEQLTGVSNAMVIPQWDDTSADPMRLADAVLAATKLPRIAAPGLSIDAHRELASFLALLD